MNKYQVYTKINTLWKRYKNLNKVNLPNENWKVFQNKIIIGNIIRIFDVNNGVFHGLEDKYITYLSRNSYAFYVLNSLYDKCEQQINTKDKKMNNKKTVSSVRMYIRRDKLGE